MRIEQINQVIELSRTGNMGKAAQNLLISQPNLSLSLRNLEDEVGHKIFIRTSRGVYLSDFGQEFLKYAKAVALDLNNMKNFCEFRGMQASPMSISICPQAFLYSIASAIIREHQNELLSVTLSTYSSFERMMESVQTGQTEIGVSIWDIQNAVHARQALKKNGLEYQKIGEGDFMLLMRRNHPLIENCISEVSFASLEKYPLLVVGDSNDVAHRMMNENAGLFENRSRSVITCTSGNGMQSILENSDAFSFTIHYMKAYEKYPYNPNLQAVRIQGCSDKFEIGWFKRLNTELSPLVVEFISKLEELRTV
ncbi:MAG: LysR family transcriptional regulator [Candidatus Cloacimonetes bacterium]|nr:LysR family transcriptional regulator [Candidatus Cloacimonadota bacterium]